MAKISEITKPRINSNELNDIAPILVERKFGRLEDFIEIHISDLNGNILDSIHSYKGYTVPQGNVGGTLTNEIDLDPKKILEELGYVTGVFDLHINIQKRKIFNIPLNEEDDPSPFKLHQISPNRTELKLSTTLGNTRLASNSNVFIRDIQNSPFFRDFTLNFGSNKNILGVNLDIDKSNPKQFLLLVKLFEPLPEDIIKGAPLILVEDIVEPIKLRYDLGDLPPLDTSIPLRGPNFRIDTRLNGSIATAFKSYDNILTTSTTSSYQKLLSKLDGYEIPEIDYSYIRPISEDSVDFSSVTPTHFENFIHFGSAAERLKNFKYKLKLLEIYDTQLSDIGTISGDASQTTTVKGAVSTIETKKENLIQGFDGYEQFLYFESGSYSWPKTNTAEPYTLYPITHESSSVWMGSSDSRNQYYGGQLSSASIFDSQNPNRLNQLTPTFIGDDLDNEPFMLFCDMVGNHFDPIWAHIKEITQIRDNSHKYGISKDMVYYALQGLGIKTYDQFENKDLIDYMFGEAAASTDTVNMVKASDEVFSKQDMTKEVWKRLYHNAPYLLKTKGTERGLRALINCYGVPDTILDIKEYGSSTPDKTDFKLYSYNKYTQALKGSSKETKGTFIQTEWTTPTTNELSSSAKTVEFRIKPTREEEDYHLFSLIGNVSSSDLHLLLEPYTGSYDFFEKGDKTQYGKLNLHQFTSSIAESSGVGEIMSTIELVENGAFVERLGSELITNGDFAVNSDWVFGQPSFGTTGIVNGASTVDVDSSNSHNYVAQSMSYVVGRTYKVTFRAKGSEAKIIRTQDNFSDLGGLKSSQTSVTLTTNFKTYSFNWVANSNSDTFAISRSDISGNWSFVIDDVSVKEANPEWTIYGGSGTQWLIKDGAAQAGQGTDYGYMTQIVPEIVEGHTYEITYDVTVAASGGSLILANHTDVGGVNSNVHLIGETAVGTYKVQWIQGAALAGKIKLYNDSTFDGTIDNISVKEVLIPEGYFPIYNGNFWDIHLGTDGTAGSDVTLKFGAYQSNHLREVDYYTSSVSITEQQNAESFGNHLYSETYPLITGSHTAYIGGIEEIYNPLALTLATAYTSSHYTTANTGSAFDLEYSGSLSEVRYYFGELLSHETLKKHALEPLMYAGNTISSSYDSLILRYPLSFELDINHEVSVQIPSSSSLWNTSPTPDGLISPQSNLVGPITGGAVLSSSLDVSQTSSTATTYSGQPFPGVSVPLGSDGAPVFTVAGVPLLRSHHPNEKVNYLGGYTFLTNENIEVLEETHHLPTPNTIGKSAVNRKVRIDTTTTDDDILSSTHISSTPSSLRQAPDFDSIGVFLSPQNEVNEDIIYTLGTFSLDEFLGDPRDQTASSYPRFNELQDYYFKKLEKGSQKQNIFDFTRWVQFLDHTLFDLIKQFVPQKSTVKTGLLIEPHYLERVKFPRNHPILSNHLYDSNLQETTASFHKNNNTSQLNNTTGSAVISNTINKGLNITQNIFKHLTGSSVWNQGGSNELRLGALTPQNNFINSKVSKKKQKTISQNKNLNIAILSPNSGWVTGTGVSISGNTGIFTSVPANQKLNLSFSTNTAIKTGRTYKLKYTISGWSAGGVLPRIIADNGDHMDFITNSTNGTFTQTVTIDGSSNLTTQSNRFYFQKSGSDTTLIISDFSFEEVNPLRDIEFDDSLIDMASWKLPRYEGSKLTGVKINKYTPGDITYGLNPVAEQRSTAIYFGKTVIGADGEDDNLTTIKNHSYIDIEKILIINKDSDKITTIDLKNENFKGVNGYVANDFKGGSKFNIELLDDKIHHKLKDTYTSRFSQGYLYKVIDYLGDNGGGNVTSDVLLGESVSSLYLGKGVFCYGNSTSTINDSSLKISSNTLTKQIWTQENTFGTINFEANGTNFIYDSPTNYASFINSILIAKSIETNKRLFTTANKGQRITYASYEDASGLQNISTVEWDLGSYDSEKTGQTTISSANNNGYGGDIKEPDHYTIPLKAKDHNLIQTVNPNSSATWPVAETGIGAGANGSGINVNSYFSDILNDTSIYQISYLEETNTIIADIDKITELANDVGDEGYILIPDNLDKDIKDNIDFYLYTAGMKSKKVKKSPKRGR